MNDLIILMSANKSVILRELFKAIEKFKYFNAIIPQNIGRETVD